MNEKHCCLIMEHSEVIKLVAGAVMKSLHWNKFLREVKTPKYIFSHRRVCTVRKMNLRGFNDQWEQIIIRLQHI